MLKLLPRCRMKLPTWKPDPGTNRYYVGGVQVEYGRPYPGQRQPVQFGGPDTHSCVGCGCGIAGDRELCHGCAVEAGQKPQWTTKGGQ